MFLFMCVVEFGENLYLQEELTWHGVEWTGPVSTDSTDQIDVPLCRNPLPQYLYDILLQYINVHAFDVIESEQMYIATRLFVETFC